MVATDLFSALANPVRRQILEHLLNGPTTVNSLVSRFKLQRPAVSEHLQVLRNAKLVRDERHGRERHYQIEAKRLAEISEWLKPFEQFWRKKMKSLNDVLNEEYP